MGKATKAQTAARVEELVQVRLDGAFLFSQIREYAREREKEKDTPWTLAEGDEPLSDGQLRRLVQRADEAIAKSIERSRKRLLRRHLAQRRNLYARAVTTGEIRTALAVLQDEADLLGFYKQRVEHSGRLEETPVEQMSDEELLAIAASARTATPADTTETSGEETYE
jgi:hypothetical protein